MDIIFYEGVKFVLSADVLSSNLKSVAPRGNQLAVLSWNDTITDIVKDLLFL